MRKKKEIFSSILVLLISLQIIFSSMLTVKVQAFEDIKSNDSTIIDVTNYGADPSGKEDSAIAIQKAIEEAKKVDGPVTINFPKGQYDIYPDYAAERELYISNTVGADEKYKMKKIGILIEDMKDVTIEGNGSLFMYHGKMTTFAAINSSNIVFQNFKVDFQTPTVIDITVESVDSNSATVYVPECYNYTINGTSIVWESEKSPYTEELYWSTSNSMAYTQLNNVKTGLTWRGGNNLFKNLDSIEDLGNNRLKFNYTNKSSDIEAGICYQMRPTVRDHAGVFLWQSKDIKIKNIDIYFLHGFGVVGQFTENITIDGVNFDTPAESGRTTAGYADFIQMSGCKGEINVLNSSFSNPHDDPINVHGTFLQVVERISDRKFKVQYKHNETAGFPNFYVGDEVEFMTQGNMIPVENSKAKVVEVSGPTGDSSENSLTDIIITLDRDMPDVIVPNKYVVENITYTPSVNIRNNVFKETPTRGILVTTRKKVVIEDNVFDGMGMAAIYISNDAQGWYESGPVKDVLIRNNIFKRSGVGTSKQPVIYIDPTNPTVSTENTVHDNITITDNTFYMADTNVLGAKSVSNLTFKNNNIYRYDPNVNIDLSSEKTELKLGESLVLDSKTSANELKTKLYYLNGCKNVVIENNNYDGGLNLSGSFENMNNSDIIQKDGILFNDRDNITNKIGKILYKSSNEDVIKVSSDGVVKAVGEGSAEVTAFTIINNRKFESNKIQYKVAGSGQDVWVEDVTIADGNDRITEINKPVKLTAEVLPKNATDKSLIWKVLDPNTGEESKNATIENGILTPKANGVVEVVARAKNGVEDRKLVVIQENVNKQLSSNFSVKNELKDKWSIVNDNDIKIYAQKGSLWAGGTTNNIIVGSFDKDLTNVTATVKVSGFTKASYDESGLIFFNDENNYVSVERKHANGNPRIHVVTEMNGNPNEDGAIENSTKEDIYYKLIKNGNNITGYYSEDGKDWKEVRTVENSNLGNNFKIGIIASGGEATNTPFIFSELTIDDKNVDFTSENRIPEVSNVNVSYDEDSNILNSDYKFTDDSNEGNTIVKWAASDKENGKYKIVSGLQGNNIVADATLNGKYVKSIVVPKDSTGVAGNIVWSSNSVLVKESIEETIPNLKSSNDLLKEAKITGVNFSEFNSKENCYITTASEEVTKLNFDMLSDSNEAIIDVIGNGKEIVKDSKNIAQGEMELVSGINVLEVNVKPADEKSVREYRFVVIKKGDNNSRLSEIQIDNKKLVDFNSEKNEYTYIVDDANKNSVNIKAIADSNKSSVIIRDGKYSVHYGDAADIKLYPGVNKIVVGVNPETSAPINYYTINVKVPKMDNTNLEKMYLGENIILDKVFSSDVTDYKGTVSKTNNKISLSAEDLGATIKLDVNGKVYLSNNSVLEKEILLHKGYNLIKVTVISQDKSEKEYRVELEGKDYVYLSDIDYLSDSFSGWGNIEKDKSVGKLKLSLLNKDGEKVEFDKGLGTHATSQIGYNIEGKGFKKLETYIGVDSSQENKGNVVFKILTDGKEVYNSGEMTGATPMKFVSIDLSEVKKLTLVCEKGENDWNDHADFADAKFITEILEEDEVQIKELINDALLRAKNKEEEGFNELTTTKSTWAEYQHVLENVNNLLDKENLSIEEVRDNIKILDDAIENLKIRANSDDINNLNSLINENKEISSNYPTNIYNNMSKIIEKAENILLKDIEDISEDEVNDIVAQIISEKELLDNYLSDKINELKNKIEEANKVINNGALNLYKNLKEAVDEGNRLISENSKNAIEIESATNKINKELENIKQLSQNNENNGNGSQVQTGDKYNVNLFMLLFFISIIGMIILKTNYRNKNIKE